MLTIGLTGGIGMGKSAAADWFLAQGMPVVDSDQLARQVVEPGQPALSEIGSAFGEKVLQPDGSLNRQVLAEIVFKDPRARHLLEGITHARIRQLWLDQFRSWRDEGRNLAVAAVPLLFEIHAESEFDATICVACSVATQRDRLRERGWKPEQIDQRIQAQWPIEKKMALATYVIWNEGSLELLGSQLEAIIQVLPASRRKF